MPSEIELQRKLASKHIRLGWLLLALFVVLGIVLESLHGFKIDWYLNASLETRRLTWRLAHAHGTFLAIVHQLFAHSIERLNMPMGRATWVSHGVTMASLFVPFGFFLGGLNVQGGDPGVGIALLPLGALALVVALLGIALSPR